ncbi:MAG: hypothetical protein M3N08_05935 [Pseudomonadota bacterium]|nr:hypothetical protein [Pseudomonadota bacterium]
MLNSLKAAVLLGVVMLAGCMSGVHKADTYTDSSGKTTIIETDRETCVRSCNEEYSRCMDTEPAQTSGVHGPAGMFGASADCRSSLKQCLPSCNGR